MSRNRILLISPTLISEVPMTLAMLGAVFQKEGFKVFTAVNTFKKPLSIKDFVDKANEYEVDVVGISMLTFEVLFVYKLIKALKEEGIFVIVGGPHPTDKPEECIKFGSDVVIVGEGENVIKDICREYPAIKKGIRERKLPINLTELPKPLLDIFDLNLFRGEDGLIRGFHRLYTTRGCPGQCTFCDWQVFKQTLRAYPINTIIDGIKERVEKYGITTFSIADDCFTLNHKHVYEFCEKISKIRPRITWRANSRANLVNRELLKAMRESGCHSIAFGLESGDVETLKRIKKFVNLEQNIKAPWIAHEVGLEVYGCLMTGFPWETPKNIENTIKLIKETWEAVSLFQVSGSLMPFPGTEIYREYAKQYGFEEYWLKPEYQKTGIQVYQNYINPLSVSSFYQRYLFDDTYIQKEVFFKYTKEYKKKVRELVWEIGKHNLPFMLKDQSFKQKLYLVLSKLSMIGYDYLPSLETKIGGKLFELFNKGGRSKVEKLRDKRRGFVKNK